MSKDNIFLSPFKTRGGAIPFDRITTADYEPAIMLGIKEHDAQVESIVNNSEEPTFENTVEAYERSGEILSKVTGVLFNLSETDATDNLNNIVEEAVALITEHSDNIFMDARFYKRVAELYEDRLNLDLTPEQMTVLEHMNRTFVRNGINLPEEQQTRLREINKQLSTLEQKFGNNLRNENNAFSLNLTENDLEGLPEAVRTALAENAK